VIEGPYTDFFVTMILLMAVFCLVAGCTVGAMLKNEVVGPLSRSSLQPLNSLTLR
jgi:hypothetical protein